MIQPTAPTVPFRVCPCCLGDPDVPCECCRGQGAIPDYEHMTEGERIALEDHRHELLELQEIEATEAAARRMGV